MDTLLSRLQSIDSLPVLPEVVNQINYLIVEDRGGAKEISQLVERDTSLAFKVLQCANSSFYNYSGKTIDNLNEAVVRIGREELYSMLLTVSMIAKMPRPELNTVNFRAYWIYSLATALVARRLQIFSSKKVVQGCNSLYSAALLHDVGMLITGIYFPSRYKAVAASLGETPEGYAGMEQRLFPEDCHSVLGAALLERWAFDRNITAMVKFHERPTESPLAIQPMTSVIHIASSVVGTNIQEYIPWAPYPVDSIIYDLAGLDEMSVGRYAEIAREEIERAASILVAWAKPAQKASV